jgi:predicted dehydrogenase
MMRCAVRRPSAAGTGGYFSWLGCHTLDLIHYLTGQQIVAVTAKVGVYGLLITLLSLS